MKINQKILVVDDKGMNRFMLGGMFRDNFEILEAANGLEAIEVLEKEQDELAVVLLESHRYNGFTKTPKLFKQSGGG